MIGLEYMERAYPEEPQRIRAWRRLATALGILTDDDPRLAAERRRRELAKVQAEFGEDD